MSMSLSQATHELASAEGRLARIRKASKEVAHHLMCGGAAVAAGGLCGFVNGRYGYNGQPAMLPGTTIPVDMALVGLGVGAFAFGLGGKYKDLALYAAIGAGSQTAGRFAFQKGGEAQGVANAQMGAPAHVAGAIAGGQYAGAVGGGQYAGAVGGGQYVGAVPGGHYG